MARKSGSHSDITGPRIREAALRLFARHGFAAVSMRQIAAAVGVQAGALYLYTPDKEALLVDLLESHMEDLLSALEALPAQPSPVAALDQFVRFHIGWNLGRTEAVFLSYMELRNLSPGNFARIETLRRSYESRLESILAAGVAAQVFAIDDTRVTTLAIIAMLTGVTSWYRPDGRLSQTEIAGLYGQMVARMVGAVPVRAASGCTTVT